MPNRLQSFFKWLTESGEPPKPPPAPPPVVDPFPEPVVETPPPMPTVREIDQFKALFLEKTHYEAARLAAVAAINELFSKEEDRWKQALENIRKGALDASSGRISGEELNVVASNFASDILFVTNEHQFFDCTGGFGQSVIRLVTRFVLGAEAPLGKKVFKKIAWPQPFWSCSHLPPLDNKPAPLQLVATRHLSILSTSFTSDDLADAVNRIESELLERAAQHRQALVMFVEHAIAARKDMMNQWIDQLEALEPESDSDQ